MTYTSRQPPEKHHILSLLVENKAGVLARIAGLFSRRGYSIYSLTVAPTDTPTLSRITVTVDVASTPLTQIIAQLDKLINVITIYELDPLKAVDRELLLATVRVSPGRTENFEQCLRQHSASLINSHTSLRAVDEPEYTTVSLTGTSDQLDRFEEDIRSYGIMSIQRSGVLALPLDPTITYASN